MNDTILFISIYLALVFITTFSLEKSRRKGIRFFFLCLLLTPIAGIIKKVKINIKPRGVHTVVRYRCTRCGYQYTEYQKYCGICEAEGHRIELKKQVMKVI